MFRQDGITSNTKSLSHEEKVFFFSKKIITSCLRVFVLVVGLVCAGCVPIRQALSPGDGHSVAQGRSAPSAPDPSGDSWSSQAPPPTDKDPWKNEMEGVASWYGADFNGHLTASGEVYDMYEYTAAHKTLPLGTVVKVTNLESGKSTEVRINDRGPYVEGRVIDLSRTAGRAIGIREAGITKVKLEIVRMPKG